MAVNRIVDRSNNTDGWQARWSIPGEGRKRWTRFFAVKRHGFTRSYDLACEAERQFKKRANGMVR